jgi:ABC-type phosphate/phosphonate transport system substrate-binding protein
MVTGFALVVVLSLHAAAAEKPAAPAPAAPAPALRIGLIKPMFKDVPTAMVNAAARPFQNMIEEKAGVKGSVELFPDYRSLARDIKDGKIDIGVFHGFEYAWVKDTPGLVPLVATLPSCGKVQACLVVGKDSKANSPKDLKGACVLVPRSTKAHCFMFLDHLREKLPAGDCCPAKTAGLTPEEALGEVAVGNSEAVLVDYAALVALKNNCPGCFANVRVLAESELLPSAVVVYRKGSMDERTSARVTTGLLGCVNTPIGRTFALFWQLKGFGQVDDAYNAVVEKCLKAYPQPPEHRVCEPKPAPDR